MFDGNEEACEELDEVLSDVDYYYEELERQEYDAYVNELAEECFEGDTDSCDEYEEIILDYVEELMLESDVEEYDMEYVEEVVEDCLGGN